MYSFRRLDADVIHNFCLGKSCSAQKQPSNDKTLDEIAESRLQQRISVTDAGSNPMELRLRGHVSITDTSSGQSVPFYLMRTLGGSDITGSETLRGFANSRFRDNDMVLLQAEFLMRLRGGPINLLVFNDAGKVAPSLKQFGVGRPRDTFGIGLAIVPSQLHAYLFRFYIALGSGEGYHITAAAGDPSAVGTRLFR